MTLRKITIINSVRSIPIIEKTKEKENKSKKIKAGSIPRKQNKKPQNKKKILKNISASGFTTLTN